MKISVITPSYNSSKTIELAIKSVLDQDYKNFEHIVVDGGSTDETIAVLSRHPHLRWISEPDRGQVHAMSKGLAMAEGDIIGYLNADDYYLENAFSSVIPHFKDGEKMVMGKVLIRSQKASRLVEAVCDPKTDFNSMLRHWEPNAFCYNPVGYFYLREVQNSVPLREETGDKHDLEFLLEVSRLFSIKKIDAILGVFNYFTGTQTVEAQSVPSYWQVENFPFVTRLAAHLSEPERKIFYLSRDRGYQVRRQKTAKEAFDSGMAMPLFENGEVILLPEGEECARHKQCGFVDFDHIGTKGDWIIPVLSLDKVGGLAISHSLKALSKEILPAQVYYINTINKDWIVSNLSKSGLCNAGFAKGLALNRILNRHNDFYWKFIAGVRDPIAQYLSEASNACKALYLDDEGLRIDLFNKSKYFDDYFNLNYNHLLNIDIFNFDFDYKNKFVIIHPRNKLEILMYRFEDLSEIYPCAVEEFLGITDLKLQSTDIGKNTLSARFYEEAVEGLRFDPDFLKDFYFSSQVVKHFYTSEEIDIFIEKWSRKSLEGSAIPPLTKHRFHDLIFDIGLHEGQDTEFYLKKGFRVLAVDANPVMIQNAEAKFFDFVKSGQLKLLNVGIVEVPIEEKLTFYINERCTEWSSFIPEVAGRDGGPCSTVQVNCTTIENLGKEFGEPYYVKIDIEGYDHIALASLKQSGIRPPFVSVENGNMGMLNTLLCMGYDRFKYVQQNNMPNIVLPYPSMEGIYVTHKFPQGASGPFGEETQGDWKCAAEIRGEIARVWDPDGTWKNPAHKDERDGWFDLHAKHPKQ